MTTTATTTPSRTPVPPSAAWPGLPAAATETCLDALLEGAGQDWSRPADGLAWTCRETLDHLALGLTGYAGLLIARPTDRYITLFASLDPRAPVPACPEGVRIAARLLGSTVSDTPPDVRAWHPWGHADAVTSCSNARAGPLFPGCRGARSGGGTARCADVPPPPRGGRN
ncbi:hypothetical protein AB0B15_29525 [Streptomyces sp. NPDC045456]|uniref:hypothetical protein n=1 Tax=Streptomyces sp. NPDC045456 TaxID=3155254 RepID=UPI0033E21180